MSQKKKTHLMSETFQQISLSVSKKKMTELQKKIKLVIILRYISKINLFWIANIAFLYSIWDYEDPAKTINNITAGRKKIIVSLISLFPSSFSPFHFPTLSTLSAQKNKLRAYTYKEKIKCHLESFCQRQTQAKYSNKRRVNKKLKCGNKFVMSYKRSKSIIAIQISGNYPVPDPTRAWFCWSILCVLWTELSCGNRLQRTF